MIGMEMLTGVKNIYSGFEIDMGQRREEDIKGKTISRYDEASQAHTQNQHADDELLVLTNTWSFRRQ